MSMLAKNKDNDIDLWLEGNNRVSFRKSVSDRLSNKLGGGAPSGGGGGGTVVGGPSPQAALLAGQYQSQAAQSAATAAQQQTGNAINLLREQYGNAFSALKPYTTSGIQALNELNSYMGLGAYNPGSAPRAPDDPNTTDWGSRVTDDQIRSYVQNNITPNKDSSGSYRFTYTGSGIDANTPGWIPASQNGLNTPAGYYSYAPLPTGDDLAGGMMTSLGTYMSDPTVTDNARMNVAKQLQQQYASTYDTTLDNYNQQMDVYNYAKGLYDQYSAQGPMTAQQVTDKLMSQPGVEFQYNQGLDTLQRAASSKGMMGSGRLLQALNDYGQGMASQQYAATLDRLSGMAGAGQQAGTGIANISSNLGQQGAGLYANLGDTQANSYLAAGNARAQALLAAGQQYQIIGGDQGGGGGGGGLGGLGSLLGGAASLGSSLSGLFSSKELKDTISTPSTEEILKRVSELDIDLWRYKGIDRTHIGPYAEDFNRSFGGSGNQINIIDYLGVLMASVKELNKQVISLKEQLHNGS